MDTAAFVTYIFVMAFTPGPNNLLSMSNAARLGFRKGFPFNLGVLAGFLLIACPCALLGGAVAKPAARFLPLFRWLAAAYMLYLAVKALRSAEEPASVRPGSGFVTGTLLQFVNPKLYLYCVTALSAYVLPYYTATLPLLGFAALLAATAFASTLCWALFGSAFQRILSRRGKRAARAATALLLVYCAVSLFL